MRSEAVLLGNVSGKAEPVEATAAFAGTDLDHFFVDMLKTKGVDFDLARSITDGYIERSIDTASTVSVTIHDPQRELLSSAAWDETIDLSFEGFKFRLVGVSKQGDDITLTFEDLAVMWMRYKTGPLKMARGKVTRAEFIKHMIDEIKADNKANLPLEFFSPELKKKQDIKPNKPVKRKKEKDRRKNKEPGLHKKIKLKDPQFGTELTKEQKSNIERVLDVGYSMKVPKFLLICSVMCIWQESRAGAGLPASGTVDGVHWGLFQQDRRYYPGTNVPEKDAPAFFRPLLRNYKAAPGVRTAANLIESVQRSGQASLYAQWYNFGVRVVAEYTGEDANSIDVSGSNDGGPHTYTETHAKTYMFMRGAPDGPRGENTYQAALRLADEVRWRFFVVAYRVYYVKDAVLMKAKPIMVIDEESDGIISIDYDHDVGKKTAEATILCNAERWFAHPGEVIQLEDSLGPAKGRWLVQRIHRPIFSRETEITLYRPQKALKEPAPELVTVTHTVRGGGHGSVGDTGVGSGKISIEPGANRAGQPMSDLIIAFLEEIAKRTDEQILVHCGTNHDKYTVDGNISDHYYGMAADISVGGDARASVDPNHKAVRRKGSHIAIAALEVCGVRKEIATPWAWKGLLNFASPASTQSWRGHRVQIGWLTLNGGNHYNHVHVGLR